MSYEPDLGNTPKPTAGVQTAPIVAGKTIKKKKPVCKHLKALVVYEDSYWKVSKCPKCKQLISEPKTGLKVSVATFFDKEAQNKRLAGILASLKPVRKPKKAKKANSPASSDVLPSSGA